MESRESIDDAFRRLEKAMGSEQTTKLVLELNAAKSAVFAEVLGQATLQQHKEFDDALTKIEATLEDQHRSWKERRTPIDGELTPIPGEVVYEFRRPRGQHAHADSSPRFPEDYALVGTVGGDDPGGEQGLSDAMQAIESQGRYLVMKGDVITSPDGTNRLITEDGIHRTGEKITFTAEAMTWEVIPARTPERRTGSDRPEPSKDAKIAEAVEQDLKTWKAIRSQGAEKPGTAQSRENQTREVNER